MTTQTPNLKKEIKGSSAKCPHRKEKPNRCNLCGRITSGTTGKQRYVRNLWCNTCFELYKGRPLMFLEKVKQETIKQVQRVIDEINNEEIINAKGHSDNVNKDCPECALTYKIFNKIKVKLEILK